jgi:histidinol-phosphate aminotransferase
MPLKVDPKIASLVPYVPGKPLDELERELGIPKAIKLASNENPRGPSPKAMSALSEAAATVNRYPDGGGHKLRQALADRWKVEADQVMLGNGSDELLGLLARAFLSPGDEAVMADHTFVIYKMVVTAVHAQSVEVPLVDWRHDLSAMAEAVTPRTRLLFVCNPNNPTGTIVTAEAVDALMARLREDVIVVFDEAYYEYVRSGQFPDVLTYLQQGRNVVVLRTFSKIYGLAGLRIGYGLTTTEIAGYVNRVRPPFNTNSLAQQAAVAALEDEEHVAQTRLMNEVEMTKVREGLACLGLQVIPSEANFLYFDAGRDGAEVFAALLRKGVIVRHIWGRMVRVTIGLAEENDRFLLALGTVLGR